MAKRRIISAASGERELVKIYRELSVLRRRVLLSWARALCRLALLTILLDAL